jgi:hypothetical protein
MKPSKVLVYDDQPTHQSYWEPLKKRAESEGFEVSEEQPSVEDTLRLLEERRVAARSRRHADWETNDIDRASIVVIDYDLALLKNSGFVTGENFAYLARCYSECGVIVGLNQFHEVDFDLTLKGHLESFADLNINDRWLGESGLWKTGSDGFRPWHWPLLPGAVKRFETRISSLLKPGALDASIADVLELRDVVDRIPRAAAQFLSQKPNALDVKVRDFVLHSGSALRHKDQLRHDRAMARVAAARLAKWLERLVQPGQDILVDAPHLVSRFPSLLRNKATTADWNRTAAFAPASQLNLEDSNIEKHRFKSKHWLPREAWFWPSLSLENDRIQELKDPWSSKPIRYVFCEDYSRFYPREDAREFVADLPSVFVRRFARKHDPSIKYGPQIRFAL